MFYKTDLETTNGFLNKIYKNNNNSSIFSSGKLERIHFSRDKIVAVVFVFNFQMCHECSISFGCQCVYGQNSICLFFLFV